MPCYEIWFILYNFKTKFLRQIRKLMRTYKRNPFLRQKPGSENDNFQKVIL
jgi:hypothetical protein